jgi:hypothetical protein
MAQHYAQVSGTGSYFSARYRAESSLDYVDVDANQY